MMFYCHFIAYSRQFNQSFNTLYFTQLTNLAIPNHVRHLTHDQPHQAGGGHGGGEAVSVGQAVNESLHIQGVAAQLPNTARRLDILCTDSKSRQHFWFTVSHLKSSQYLNKLSMLEKHFYGKT